jgi:hypothetical protein
VTISIYACHSGEGFESPAQSFVDSQRVTTYGLQGYGYFSENENNINEQMKIQKMFI